MHRKIQCLADSISGNGTLVNNSTPLQTGYSNSTQHDTQRGGGKLLNLNLYSRVAIIITVPSQCVAGSPGDYNHYKYILHSLSQISILHPPNATPHLILCIYKDYYNFLSTPLPGLQPKMQ